MHNKLQGVFKGLHGAKTQRHPSPDHRSLCPEQVGHGIYHAVSHAEDLARAVGGWRVAGQGRLKGCLPARTSEQHSLSFSPPSVASAKFTNSWVCSSVFPWPQLPFTRLMRHPASLFKNRDRQCLYYLDDWLFWDAD